MHAGVVVPRGAAVGEGLRVAVSGFGAGFTSCRDPGHNTVIRTCYYFRIVSARLIGRESPPHTQHDRD